MDINIRCKRSLSGTILGVFLLLTSSIVVAQSVEVKVDTAVTTHHEQRINGQEVAYTATTGNQPVWDEEGKPIASLFYTYYKRTDVDNSERRPLVISFNGGPGSASVWMHIGYTGPKKVKISDEGFPVQPYGVENNPHSILDVADIIYVNPVNTGFSRIVDKEVKKKKFFGVNADIEYLADWIDTFVSRHDRWKSPKFLIGESYGTTRVSGLADELQDSQWMFLNGVILVSPTGLGIDRDGPVGDALTLPYFTAAAWYHNALPKELQERDLSKILPEVEAYTIDTYIPALAKGGALDESKKEEVAKKVSYFSGISKKEILNRNLSISTSFFWKELLRDEKELTIGRLDSRYRGQDPENAGNRYTYDPALSSWNHAFTPAINHYLRSDLGYNTDLQYWMFGPVHPWDRDNNRTGKNLRSAMNENPYLNVMVQSGYYDGGTPYFDAKYTIWNMDRSGKLQDRIQFKGYRSGHMMYLRKEDLEAANNDIRTFIKQSIPKDGVPAKY
ncbi:S10 family peptidase [Fodinibius halophilus]|uniref:Carboxypeptidase n=1 Tax=Fodinibius halophilus TaxID=1736908 RepID=A0A6M1TH17_9BACT|nr:carboxypeptidase [Fodinibius halophilus]NGP87940.1 carboxypeptidase [Fodinibius halophilus]